MEQHEEIEMQIWEYLDGLCNEQDRLRISLLIEQETTWEQVYTELLLLHKGFKGNFELEQPSLRFSKNVMETVAHCQIAPPTKKYINFNLIKGIAAFFVLSVVSMFVYIIFTHGPQTNSLGQLNLFNNSNFNISNYIKGSYFKGSYFNLLLIVNVILVLVLADKMMHHNKKLNTKKVAS